MNHDRDNGRMAHYRDLRELYAKSLEYHGIGYALYQPVAAADLTPPCAGYFDRNGNFNVIARLSATSDGAGLVPLEYLPHQQAQIGIEWKPKTSLGVIAMTVDTSGEGPNVGVPASASAHIKYSSKSSFGAVVIASKPVTMTGYYDERLFLAWLAANKDALIGSHGTQLRRYGMWIVTQTHTAPSCWINAWHDKSREAIVSLKAKANMMGGLAEDLDLDDQSSDRDWTHYTAKDGAGVVVFMDGIEVKPMEWYLEGFKQTVGLSRSSSRTRKSSSSSPIPLATTSQTPAEKDLLAPHQSDRTRSLSASPPSAAAAARRASYVQPQSNDMATALHYDSQHSPDRLSASRQPSTRRSSSSVRRHSHLVMDTGGTPGDQHGPQSPTDDQTLRDIGITHSLSRSLSTVSHSSIPRTPSLRRDVRSVSSDQRKSWSVAPAEAVHIQQHLRDFA